MLVCVPQSGVVIRRGPGQLVCRGALGSAFGARLIRLVFRRILSTFLAHGLALPGQPWGKLDHQHAIEFAAKDHDTMSDKIVVGTDGSETANQAVDEAIRLAKALGGELCIVSSFEPFRSVKVQGVSAGNADVMAPRAGELARGNVEEAAARARNQDVKVDTHAVEKDPADALLEVAAEVGASMIVVGNRGMHGAKRLLGSVPNTVSHRAPCNVLIVSTTPD
jgi:nucleotide-binding universal stress UspA family protein